MWPLRAFRFDDGIDASDVYLFNEAKGELELLARADALAVAWSHGQSLVAQWPSARDDDVPTCIVAKVSLPLRWEVVPRDDRLDLDSRLWFDAPCGSRDFLLAGQGHTFPGRMTAWCPDKAVSYNVSLGEMGAMSDEARYFVLGFLSGNEPDPPKDEDGNIDSADFEAWRRRLNDSGRPEAGTAAGGPARSAAVCCCPTAAPTAAANTWTHHDFETARILGTATSGARRAPRAKNPGAHAGPRPRDHRRQQGVCEADVPLPVRTHGF